MTSLERVALVLLTLASLVAVIAVSLAFRMLSTPDPAPAPVKTTFCLAEPAMGMAFCNDSVDGKIVREYRVKL